MKRIVIIVSILLLTAAPLFSAELRNVKITGSKDGQLQPARVFIPADRRDEAIPLLVVLHSWSGDWLQEGSLEPCLAECERRDWALVHPNFRGPNFQSQACASELAVQDVLDAVEFMKKETKVDERRIYVMGSSGGGHMSLVMAARAPKIWAGVSAWVPITDLAAWHAETKERKLKYADQLEKVCGGVPGASPKVDQQYRERSSLFHFDNSADVRIDINAGIDDGHTGSVPISHTLRAFNRLAEVNELAEKKLTDGQIREMTDDRTIPKPLLAETVDEPGRKHDVLFRRIAGPVRVTIFQGGHEGDVVTAIRWLAEQRK